MVDSIKERITSALAEFEAICFSPPKREINHIDKVISLGEELLRLVPPGKFTDVPIEVAFYLANSYDERARYHSHYGYYDGADHPRNIRQAIDDYSRIIQLLTIAQEKPRPEVYERRCECYLEKRLFDDALVDANRVIELLNNAQAYLLRSRCYHTISNYDRAKADAVYAMEIAQDFRDSRGAFDAYHQVCSGVVAEHECNLKRLIEQYKAGERDFRGIDISWTDLTDTNLQEANLSGANLESCILRNVDFSKAILHGANLQNTLAYSILGECKVIFDEANLQEANLRSAKLSNVSFHQTNLGNTDLHKAILHSADLRMAKLQGAVFYQTDLTEARMQKLELVGADFREAILWGVYLEEANLKGAQLNTANLTQAHLNKADLSDADLTQSNLFEADLTEAILKRANLSNAMLCQARLHQADLDGANFRNADLGTAYLIEANNVSRANLAEADRLPFDIPKKLANEWRKQHKRTI